MRHHAWTDHGVGWSKRSVVVIGQLGMRSRRWLPIIKGQPGDANETSSKDKAEGKKMRKLFDQARQGRWHWQRDSHWCTACSINSPPSENQHHLLSPPRFTPPTQISIAPTPPSNPAIVPEMILFCQQYLICIVLKLLRPCTRLGNMKNLAFWLAEFSYYLLADRNEAKKPAQQHSIKQSTCLSSGRNLRCNQSQEHLSSNRKLQAKGCYCYTDQLDAKNELAQIYIFRWHSMTNSRH